MLLPTKSNYRVLISTVCLIAVLTLANYSSAFIQDSTDNSDVIPPPAEQQSNENETSASESPVEESPVEESPTEKSPVEDIAEENTNKASSENINEQVAEPEKIVQIDKEEIKRIKASLKEVLADDQLHRKEIQTIKEQVSDAEDLKSKQEQIDFLWHQQQILDNKNQAIVSTILDQHGWPIRKEYKGSEAGQTLFLVIQHADIEFQERYFPMMQKATEGGEIPPGAFAQLHDNILVSKGLKQRYGTQIKVNPKTNVPYIYPIEDEQNVDIRRAAVGLNPIAEYAKLYNVEYESPPDEKAEKVVSETFSQDSNSQEKPE